ncbi:MAG: hypothetical protein KGL44_03570 [Sphingomonadales bacterium]|nr:hypothetical protein [Sphingomonadales bacterium]
MLARLPRPAALLVLLGFLAVLVWLAIEPGAPVRPVAQGVKRYTDMMLYHDVVAQMDAGKGYYRAAVDLHRAHHYPLRPFFAVRPPVLAEAGHLIGWGALQMIAYGAALALVFVWAIGTEGKLHVAERIGVALLVGVGASEISAISLMAMHELWSALFLGFALAVMLWWRERWWLALPAVALALAVRELALPFLLLAAAFAAWDRHWREFAAWLALAALFFAYMAFHAAMLGQLVTPQDIASPGWHGMLGLRAFAKGVQFTSLLQELPNTLGIVVAMLPMLGWAALDGRRGAFALLLFVGYAAMIALFARPGNFYWAMMAAPAYLAGLALLPRALGQLWRTIRSAPSRA